MVEITEKFQNSRAEAKTIIGYAKNRDQMEFFEGSISGAIVRPRGISGFGWDAIFKPDGQNQTFAEMTLAEKNTLSMRKIAFEKLRDFLRIV
ncbi:MAG TPA: non-canonical purine NTP pyrophosphatase [Oligoflexia bacterium]|nr:non-canonical purine NTP pyrophosphatase [Oligoflexia bacterium]HMP27078.1 non-canonical purine NTP pyrophosphatase [Oligoflexia bacterium]